MVLRYLDSFDSYGDSGATGTALSNEMLKRWTTVSIGSPTTSTLISGWEGGLAFSTIAGNRYFQKVFDNQATWVVGFAFCPLLLGYGGFVSLYDGTAADATRQVRVAISAAGKLILYSGTTILVISVKALKSSVWCYFELKATIDNAGSAEIRINGEPWITYSGDVQRTAYARADRVEIGASSNSLTFYIDDLYIADGTAGVNTFQGPTRIENLWPTGDDATANQWQLSTGSTHYTLVDEKPGNTTDYVYETTANDVDLYTYGNLATVDTGIFGVQMNTTVALDANGSKTLIERWQAPTAIDGGSHALTVNTYVLKSTIRETDTDTNAWTATTLNAAEFGVKVG